MTDLVAYAWGPTAQAGAPNGSNPRSGNAADPSPRNICTRNNASPVTAPTLSSVTLIPVVTQAAPQTTPLPVSTVTALSLSADGFFLAPNAQGVVQVWKMPRGGTPPPALHRIRLGRERIRRLARWAYCPPTWSMPNCGSNRISSSRNCWRASTAFAPVEAAFSADATKIAYVDERSGVWIDVIADNAPQLIRANGSGETYHRPQYSPDGNSLMVDVYGSSGTAIGVLNLTNARLLETTPVGSDDPRPCRPIG